MWESMIANASYASPLPTNSDVQETYSELNNETVMVVGEQGQLPWVRTFLLL